MEALGLRQGRKPRVQSTDILEQALGQLSGGWVLDIATGAGTFVATLARYLKSYTGIIGIDTLAYTQAAEDTFGTAKFHFARMDATKLAFEDQCVDTVSISSALHHLDSISQCLAEMERVLRPGGHWIIRETHRDVQTEAQRTDMAFHHWVAEIDTALGYTHNKTFSRQALVDLVRGLGLCRVTFYDIPNMDMDPMDETAIRETETAIASYIGHAKGLPGCETFKRRGEALLRQLHEVGIQWEPELVVVSEKGRP